MATHDQDNASGTRLRAVIDGPTRVLVEVAHREAFNAVTARSATARPTLEQVCSELWRMGVVMPLGEVDAVVKMLGLPVVAGRYESGAMTKKLGVPR